ncbi:hypothetical protein [Tellurirhabdus bombi]|uniref:hypothetical protein n=1 Tax=Tellurirhabdus bombi TaxID=2907205 RepID=UPI001F171C57|nr:hypothetical protein [Tellurirhabdus bombi]
MKAQLGKYTFVPDSETYGNENHVLDPEEDTQRTGDLLNDQAPHKKPGQGILGEDDLTDEDLVDALRPEVSACNQRLALSGLN